METRAFVWIWMVGAAAVGLAGCGHEEPDTRGSRQMQALLRARPEARVLTGAASDAQLGPLLEALGLVVTEQAFACAGNAFIGPSDAILAVLPDPKLPGLPLTIVAANDAARLPREVLPGWRNGVQLWRGALLELEAPLDAAGRIDLSRARFHGAPRTQPMPALLGLELAQSLARAGEIAGRTLQPAELMLCAERREYRIHGGVQRSAHFDPKSGLTLGLPGSDLVIENARAALRQALGEPRDRWLEDGAALAAAQQLGEQELAWWHRQLARLKLPAPAEICSETAWSTHSPLLVMALRARAFQQLSKQHGSVAIRQFWKDGATPLPASWDLEAAPPPAPLRTLPSGLCGVVCAGPPDRAALEAAKAVGAKALSIQVRFALERAPTAEPRLWAEPAIGTLEGDALLAESIRAAKALGLSVLLEADVLRQPSAGLLGDHPPGSPAEWERLFAQLGARLEHLALLGESTGADALSLGSGLVGVSRAQPYGQRALPGEAELRRRCWNQLHERVRRAFGGTLTYASISLHESLELAPAAALDLLSIRCDAKPVPLRGQTRAEQRAERVEALLRVLLPVRQQAGRLGKPWLLSRSYASTAEDIELIGAALRSLPPEDRPLGVFLARWPTSLDQQPRSPSDPLIFDAARRGALARLFSLL